MWKFRLGSTRLVWLEPEEEEWGRRRYKDFDYFSIIREGEADAENGLAWFIIAPTLYAAKGRLGSALRKFFSSDTGESMIAAGVDPQKCKRILLQRLRSASEFAYDPQLDRFSLEEPSLKSVNINSMDELQMVTPYVYYTYTD